MTRLPLLILLVLAACTFPDAPTAEPTPTQEVTLSDPINQNAFFAGQPDQKRTGDPPAVVQWPRRWQYYAENRRTTVQRAVSRVDVSGELGATYRMELHNMEGDLGFAQHQAYDDGQCYLFKIVSSVDLTLPPGADFDAEMLAFGVRLHLTSDADVVTFPRQPMASLQGHEEHVWAAMTREPYTGALTAFYVDINWPVFVEPSRWDLESAEIREAPMAWCETHIPFAAQVRGWRVGVVE